MTAQKKAAHQVAPTQRPTAWLEQIVDRAMDRICDDRDRIVAGSGRVQEAMDWAARSAYSKGRLTAMLECRTASEVAEELHVHRTTVFRWSIDTGAGWRIGRDRLFLPEDVERMLRGPHKGPTLSAVGPCSVCGVAHGAT